MTTEPEADGLRSIAGHFFTWSRPIPIPDSSERIIALGQLA
jgi:hypothetical protein